MTYLHTLTLQDSFTGDIVTFSKTLNTTTAPTYDSDTGTYDIMGWTVNLYGDTWEVIAIAQCDYGEYCLQNTHRPETDDLKHWYANDGFQAEHTVTLVGGGATVGAVITAVTWENDEQNPYIRYKYSRPYGVTSVTIQVGISLTGASMNIPYREIPVPSLEEYDRTHTLVLSDTDRQALYPLLQDGEQANVRLYIRTTEVMGGETQIYENFLPHSFKFINYQPVVNLSLWDTNPDTIALTGGYDADGYPTIVRYMSDVGYKMEVTLRKGALDVIGCYIQNVESNNDGTAVGTIVEGQLEGVFDNPSGNTFYCSVTDDRGYSGYASYTFDTFYGNFIGYSKPTASAKCSAISGEGNLDITVTGNYFDGIFKVGNPNTMDIRYSIYPIGTTQPPYASANYNITVTPQDEYTATFRCSGLDYMKQHIVKIRVIDKLTEAEVTTTAVARPTFYWGKNEFHFNAPVTCHEDLIVGGVSLIQALKELGVIKD